MEFTGPYCYTLFLSGEENKRIISKKTCDGIESNFKAPVTKVRIPKIYILKYQGEIVYVGYASQSISTRLGQGIRATGLNGYYGYKWKHVNALELLVFVFEHVLRGSKHKDDIPYVAFAEAVEAELVLKVRQETGRWPEFQNEIHFNNIQLQQVKVVANEIYHLTSET